MQLRITKKLAKLLDKNSPYDIVYGEMDHSLYGAYVDYNYSSYAYDMNYSTNKLKYIKVIYPDEYYAIPTYITTMDLIRIYKHCTEKTLDAFIKEFNAEVDC